MISQKNRSNELLEILRDLRFGCAIYKNRLESGRITDSDLEWFLSTAKEILQELEECQPVLPMKLD